MLIQIFRQQKRGKMFVLSGEIMDEVIAIVVSIAVAIVVIPLSAAWVAVAMVADYMGRNK